MTGVYPIKAKLVSKGVSGKHQIVEQKAALGEGRGIVYQHDPRHVDVLVEDLGLEHGNSVQTPAAHVATEEEPEPLDQVQHSKYRLQVARCLFPSQNRADITFIVTELWQRASNPTQQSFTKLKRFVRYLKRERQWCQLLRKDGRRSDNVCRFRLGKFQGNSKIIKRRLCNHSLNANTRKQHIIARSSAEAELCAAASLSRDEASAGH